MRLAHCRRFFEEKEQDDKSAVPSSFRGKLKYLLKEKFNNLETGLQAIVVLIRPTFVKSEIFASSMAKAGVSTILSLSTFEHLLELNKADTYNSRKVVFSRFLPGVGLVKTALGSENM